MRHVIAMLVALLGTMVPCGADTVTLTHKYGVTQIEGTPQRVVSLSYIGHDLVLSLGVVPVGLRYWYGDHPFGVWPWAQDALQGAAPVVLYGDIDVEQIALLEPDLILGQWSGMTRRDYDMLSVIAPTVPPAVGQDDYGSSWQLMHERVGIALGRADEARAQIAQIEARFARVRNTHPEWQGKSASVVWPVQVGTFASQDIRSQLMQNLGFYTPPQIDALVKGNNFYVVVPQETLEIIDTDVVAWVASPNPGHALGQIDLRPMMRSHREGREVILDETLTAAMSHSSPLSLNFVLDHLVPVLEVAMDGDPETQLKNTHAMTAGMLND